MSRQTVALVCYNSMVLQFIKSTSLFWRLHKLCVHNPQLCRRVPHKELYKSDAWEFYRVSFLSSLDIFYCCQLLFVEAKYWFELWHVDRWTTMVYRLSVLLQQPLLQIFSLFVMQKMVEELWESIKSSYNWVNDFVLYVKAAYASVYGVLQWKWKEVVVTISLWAPWDDPVGSP